MDSTAKEALLQRFRDHLDSLDELPEVAADAAVGDEQTDLYALFVELAALKNETRISSRHLKGTLDQFRELFDMVRSNHDTIEETQRRHPAELEKVRGEALRPLLLELLDLKDRLEAGQRAGAPSNTSIFARFCKQEQALLTAIKTGQEMSVRRLEQILAAQQVRPLMAVGRTLDPVQMRAVEVSSDAAVAHGVITEELRKGYLWGEQLLRPAEVIVNRPSESAAQMPGPDG